MHIARPSPTAAPAGPGAPPGDYRLARSAFTMTATSIASWSIAP